MRKTQTGIIVSDKMQSTAVVEVTLWKTHRIIKKRYKRHNKFMASNPENAYKTGDMVEIMETRPQSKNKRWEIVRKIDKSTPSTPKAEVEESKTVKKSKATNKSKDSKMISSSKNENSEDREAIR